MPEDKSAPTPTDQKMVRLPKPSKDVLAGASAAVLMSLKLARDAMDRRILNDEEVFSIKCCLAAHAWLKEIAGLLEKEGLL